MAVKVLKELCEEAAEKFGATRIGVEHKLGDCPVGEASVNIVSFSPHRKAAIEATSWLIDELKTKVPIWKKEEYEEGDPAWKENAEFKEGIVGERANYE